MTETPRAQIVSALRQLWMRSKERSEALKRDNYTCQMCGKKKSTAKDKELRVNVHHKEGVTNWQNIVDNLREELLCSPDLLKTLCRDCHDTLR